MDFSPGLVIARTKTHRLACSDHIAAGGISSGAVPDSGNIAATWNALPSTGSLPGGIYFAQIVGAADPLPAECIHLENGHHWMYVHSGYAVSSRQASTREPVRPEVSVCFDCLAGLLEAEAGPCPSPRGAFRRRRDVHAIFFLGKEDFSAAGLRSEVAAAILTRSKNWLASAAIAASGNLAVDLAGSFQPRTGQFNPHPRRARKHEPQSVRGPGTGREGESVFCRRTESARVHTFG